MKLEYCASGQRNYHAVYEFFSGCVAKAIYGPKAPKITGPYPSRRNTPFLSDLYTIFRRVNGTHQCCYLVLFCFFVFFIDCLFACFLSIF